MKVISTSSMSIALMAALAVAQTPSNFTPSSSNHLSVMYGTTNIVAGALEPVQVVADQPSLGTQTQGNGAYVVLMVDPDYIYNGSYAPVLHWIQQDLIYSTSMYNSSFYTLSAGNTTAIAPYISPGPPAELPPRAHRYIQLLFRQPANLSIPSSFNDIIQTRVGFDAVQFIAETGLGPVLAADYFMVMNTSLTVATGGGTGVHFGLRTPLVAVGTLIFALIAF